MRRLAAIFAGLVLPLVLSCDAAIANDVDLDWPYWRGPEMNGISRETGLVDSWDPRGDTLLWMKEELATRSTPIVMNGKLYLLARDMPETEYEGEKVICADAATGEVLWENRFNVYLSAVPDTRVAWSSVVGDPETGHVFALGVCGHFQCINGETGETVWVRSLAEEFGVLNTFGGRTNFPIVHGDLVIISGVVIGWGEMAKPAERFIAFDKRNGQPVWFNGTSLLPEDTTYSAPVLTVVNGEAQMIFGSGDGGIHAFQPRTGKWIWKYFVSGRGINTTPVVVGNVVVCGHSEENLDSNKMGALFAIDATKTGEITAENGELWRNVEQFIGKSTPVVVDGRIYAIEDKGTLLVVDLETGKLIGRAKIGTQGRASPLFADGKLYVAEANGRCFIYRPDDEKGVVPVERQVRHSGLEINGSPIASHGRIYLPTSAGTFCFAKPDHQPAAGPRPAPPVERPIGDDPEPAWVQVVPVESLLRSGPKQQRQQFDVRLYNSRGQWLKTVDAAEVEFSIDGPGTIDGAGKYTTPAEAVHDAVTLTAKVGELTGQARIRVVPDLPWSFDFDDGDIPISWVGMRYRNVPLDFDLFEKLKGENPLAADLYIFLTSDFTNSGQPKQIYHNGTPQQRWTALLRFAGLLGEVTDLEGAKAKLDPALNLLKEQQVLAGAELSEGEHGLQLVADRGERRVEGNGVMTKITTIPKGAASQGWLGHSYFSNYTTQADVLALARDGKLPDIGVTAQRYRLDMMGADQRLRLKTWFAHETKHKEVPFEWQPETWYTIKLQASTTMQDGQKVALLQGKVWPRGEDEPTEWQIEWTDVTVNEIGSPGLFGNAKDSEIFFDNVKVWQNEDSAASGG